MRLMKKEKIEILKHVQDDMVELEHEGKTVMMLAQEGSLIGLIAVADTIKDSALDLSLIHI